MKKLFKLAFLAIGMIANAQDEMSTISLQLDPSATIKEGSANLYANIEYVGKIAYINANVQLLDGLKGGYYDFGGGVSKKITNRIYVVARTTYDYRQDFQFSGADPAYRASFFTGVVVKLNEF